ncbi:MAG: hypothetical protein ABI874_01790, partial [Chloroflexota bacterium]
LVAHQRARASVAELRDLSFDSTGISVNSYNLVLLPLWVSEFHYNDKVYPLVVNGQTGEVRGNVTRNGLQGG